MIETTWVIVPSGGVTMEKISLPFFYQLGSQLKPLTEYEVRADNRVQIFIACVFVKGNIRLLLDQFTTLTVCRTAGEELINAIGNIEKWWKETAPDDMSKPNYSVDAEFRQVVNKAKEFQVVLSAELQTLATYHVTQKGIYSTTDLIERAENILPRPVLVKMSPQVIEEIKQSGRCLAFDSATASAFHILRATEALMHQYYISMCKPSPKPTGMLDSWGAYIAEFQKSTKPEVKEVVAMLQQIKDQHRNLIMHPEVVLSPDEAFALFEIAQGAIIAMAHKLPAAKKR